MKYFFFYFTVQKDISDYLKDFSKLEDFLNPLQSRLDKFRLEDRQDPTKEH